MTSRGGPLMSFIADTVCYLTLDVISKPGPEGPLTEGPLTEDPSTKRVTGFSRLKQPSRSSTLGEELIQREEYVFRQR